LAALLVVGLKKRQDGPGPVIFLGMLVLCMLLLSPVCHLHYFCLTMPLLMGLLAYTWERDVAGRLGPGWIVLLTVHGVANLLPHFPSMEVVRDLCLAMYAALLICLVGFVALWKSRPQVQPVADTKPVGRMAA